MRILQVVWAFISTVGLDFISQTVLGTVGFDAEDFDYYSAKFESPYLIYAVKSAYNFPFILQKTKLVLNFPFKCHVTKVTLFNEVKSTFIKKKESNSIHQHCTMLFFKK